MASTVIVADIANRGWVLDRPRVWDRLLVRWRAGALDAQLAAGRPAEGSRLRAVRADLLVAPTTRAGLADCWQATLERATETSRMRDPRMPLQRSRVLAADADIRRMIGALRASAPVPARGVALAGQLLADGASPIYHTASDRDLRVAVHEAIRYLDPSADVLLV